MKKTFRTILAGAVALLAVSCYDDQPIKDAIVKLDERVSKLEQQINSDVDGINALAANLKALTSDFNALSQLVNGNNGLVAKLDAIDGKVDGKIADFDAAIKALQAADKKFDADLAAAVAKIAVAKVESLGDNVKITLVDGEEIIVSKPLTNVDNTGLITVKVDEETGIVTWVVVGENGELIDTDVVVGNKLNFRVSENGKLEYQVNGDGLWQDTGVSTSDMSGLEYVVNGVVEDENSVKLNIGDYELVLPKYAPVPAVQIKAGKQFFTAGETKTVSVGIENVANLLVMNQPYGWKANISGTTLTVTAPAEANADAENEGVIVLHGDANGACVTAVLNVVLGKGLQLTVADNGIVSVVNPIVVTTTNWWGDEMTGFVDYAIGFVETSIFESFSSCAEFYQAVTNDYEGNYGAALYANNIGLNGEYVEGSYEVCETSIPIAQLGMSCWPSVEVEKGKKYVVWALPQFSENPDASEMVYAYYEPVDIEVTPTISFDEISAAITVYGAQTVYVGAMSEADVIQSTGSADFGNYMEVGYGYGGPWAQFVSSGNWDALYAQPAENGDVISVSELVYGCTPSTKYYVYVVPVIEGKNPAEYVYEKDCRVFEFTTSALVEGAEEAELTFNEEKTDYSSVTVDVTVPAGTTAYAKFYGVGELGEKTDAEIIAHILGNYPETIEEAGSVKESYLSDGESVMLVVLTITEDGKYAIAKGTYSTKSYPILDTITATVDSITASEENGATYYTAVLSVSGANKVAVYNNYSASYSSFTSYIMSQSSAFTYADVVDGKATVKFKSRGSSYGYMLYSAFNVDSSNKVQSLMKYAYVTISEKLQ